MAAHWDRVEALSRRLNRANRAHEQWKANSANLGKQFISHESVRHVCHGARCGVSIDRRIWNLGLRRGEKMCAEAAVWLESL